jgi:hypothetical protein
MTGASAARPLASRERLRSTRHLAAGLVAALAAAILVGLGGCATGAPPTPVTSIEQLAGRWSGLISFRPRRFDQVLNLTINPDGRLVATWGSNWAWGNITIQDGQALFDMAPPPFRGDFTFYRGNGGTTLLMRERFGAFTANLTLQR